MYFQNQKLRKLLGRGKMSRNRRLFWVLLGTFTAMLGAIMAMVAGYLIFYRIGGIETALALLASMFAFAFTAYIYDIYQMEELVTEVVGVHPHQFSCMWKWGKASEPKAKKEMRSIALNILALVDEENSMIEAGAVDVSVMLDLDRQIAYSKKQYEKLRRALIHFGVDSIDLDWDKMAKQG